MAAEGSILPQYFAATLASIGAASLGTVLGWTSPMIPMLEATNSTSPVHTSPDESGWVASLLAVGAIAGAIPGGMVSNAIGRKKTMIGSAIPAILGWLMIQFATTVSMLYGARFIHGAVVGGVVASVVPQYIAEISTSAIRGTLGTMFQLFVTIGILLVYLVGALESYVALTVFCLSLSVLFFLGGLILPESPVYLMTKGKKDEADASLKFLRGAGYDTAGELGEIQKNLDASSKQQFSFNLLLSKANIKAFCGGMGLMVFQQLSGINAVIFFSSTIFEEAGSTLSPKLCSIIIGVVQCVATVGCALVADKVGRKPLLMLSGIIMGLCLGVLGYIFHLKAQGEHTEAYGWVPLASLFFFIIAFSIGFGPMPWTMIGELFAPEIKDFASSIAVALNWTLAFVVTKFFRDMTENLGSDNTFWMFSMICILGVCFVVLVLPETKGKSLQQIQEELGQ